MEAIMQLKNDNINKFKSRMLEQVPKQSRVIRGQKKVNRD